ncbi:type II CAAX prenyl endopeptidase Rce1 family protein [Halosolutus amylolyticus]|uniref:Type II CAAX prenyl endopeptidase Rce1 family protein n=1 Tax=Halosolutus amylolyticus TaxID=2932267 RepID=A0ABD5PUY8_9EURY|nr:CPBP family glutamic-type intramembrane protease [Halosolutus amylolyticus]
MPQWATFAGITGVVLVLLLVLSYLTQSSITDGTGASDRDADPDPRDEFETRLPQSGPDGPATVDRSSPPTARESSGADGHPQNGPEPQRDAPEGVSPREASSASPADRTSQVDRSPNGPLEHPPRPRGGRDRQVDRESLSTGMVLANVAASQGLFALVLIGAAIYAGIPADALGIEISRSYLETGLLWGTAFGGVLYVANEVGAAAATWFGFDHDEGLRELLAPDSIRGWLVLLVGVLPIIAVFEELLFRAALIGAVSTGFGVSVWVLAIGSSIAFALGHGMQGTVGIVVTGALGFVLAAGFILTGSFLVVVVAHYWINALEFVVHEGLGFEWASALGS